MKWIHVKALFECSDLIFGEEIVSDMFFALGLTGVVCQVPLDAPPEGFGSDALPISNETSISGYIPDIDTSIELLKKIEIRAKELEGIGIKVVIKTEIVDQQDWAESWKKFFHVSRITDKIVIKPTWREFEPKKDDIVIELDPGMAFGTGTHPTTSMCIAFIEKYLASESRFLDVGTGSGILMVTAAKLGASYIAGIDTDEVAVQVAKENLIKNSILPELFNVEKSTLDQYIKSNKNTKSSNNFEFDLIAANIIAEVLIEIMADIKTCLKKDGVVILSGIIKDREKLVLDSLNLHNLLTLETRYDGEWLAIAAKK
ncbi:MAG: 50S ribosomal protein L11 methyltransferase [Desulfamplus sp.]|nr:50S ribosomal protein L11 methyltransferase [Desulfamplus sp.]